MSTFVVLNEVRANIKCIPGMESEKTRQWKFEKVGNILRKCQDFELKSMKKLKTLLLSSIVIAPRL